MQCSAEQGTAMYTSLNRPRSTVDGTDMVRFTLSKGLDCGRAWTLSSPSWNPFLERSASSSSLSALLQSTALPLIAMTSADDFQRSGSEYFLCCSSVRTPGDSGFNCDCDRDRDRGRRCMQNSAVAKMIGTAQ